MGDFPALSLEHGQRTQRREVGPALRCGPAQHAGFGVAPDRLEDRRPLRVQRGLARTASSRGVEVGKGLGEAVEGSSRPGPGQPGRVPCTQPWVPRRTHPPYNQKKLRGAI